MDFISKSPPQRNRQLDLFGSAPAVSAFPTIISPRPCRCCGGVSATLSSSHGHGPHAGELRCAACDTHIMWAGHELVATVRLASASS
jgi:hypothetical protein